MTNGGQAIKTGNFTCFTELTWETEKEIEKDGDRDGGGGCVCLGAGLAQTAEGGCLHAFSRHC